MPLPRWALLTEARRAKHVLCTLNINIHISKQTNNNFCTLKQYKHNQPNKQTNKETNNQTSKQTNNSFCTLNIKSRGGYIISSNIVIIIIIIILLPIL